MMMGGGWIITILILFIFFILIVGVVGVGIWLFRRSSSGHMGSTVNESRSPADNSMQIVKERYASGEISRDEYERLKSDLRD